MKPTLIPPPSPPPAFLLAARAQAAEIRFSHLKERHAELITSHADLMKKVRAFLFSFFSFFFGRR